jgi:signal transduction histidine kinase
MSQMAAELSHDLRVPLSSIIAGLEMLEEELGEHPCPEIDALLDRTINAAGRMLRMLYMLIAFFRDCVLGLV